MTNSNLTVAVIPFSIIFMHHSISLLIILLKPQRLGIKRKKQKWFPSLPQKLTKQNKYFFFFFFLSFESIRNIKAIHRISGISWTILLFYSNLIPAFRFIKTSSFIHFLNKRLKSFIMEFLQWKKNGNSIQLLLLFYCFFPLL